MTATHAYSVNGVGHQEFDDQYKSYSDQLGRLLGLLDADRYFSVSLAPLPPGEGLADVDLRYWPNSYLQSAGTAERMALEVRYVEDDGVARQYAIGHPGASYDGTPGETIAFAEHQVTVFGGEVFAADEATEIFVAYLAEGRVPDRYGLRPIAP